MRAAAGDTVIGEMPAPADAVSHRMGARVEVPYTRQIESYWRPATLVDAVDAVGNATWNWHVELDPVVTAGDYLLVFRTDTDPPELEYFFPLVVS